MRLIAAIAIVAGGLAAIGIAATVGKPTDAEPLPPAPAIDLIALVTAQGQIATVASDGSQWRFITSGEEVFHAWPTWSPDASSLTHTALFVESGEFTGASLVETDLAAGTTRVLHTGPQGQLNLLAEGVAHYAIWAPNGEHLAFITAGAQGPELWIDQAGRSIGSERILDRGPLWLSWSPDSRYLLAHRDRENILVDVGGGDSLEDYSQTRIGSLAERFRVAAWSPAEPRFAYIERDGIGDHVLAIGDPQGGRTIVGRAPVVHTSLSWSPTGEYLAVLGADGLMTYRGHHIWLARGFRLHNSLGEPLDLGVGDLTVAMYWSPDGSRIAYVTAPSSGGRFSWRLYDPASNSTSELAGFIPSDAQATMFSFFDQYALSHSPWSPDGEALVFTGWLWDTVNLASPLTTPDVIALPVDAPHLAIPIAQGIMAFPSPR